MYVSDFVKNKIYTFSQLAGFVTVRDEHTKKDMKFTILSDN
jgi:hypothetical protein